MKYNLFIAKLSESLLKFRRMFWYLYTTKANIAETSYFQPIFVLFLKKVIEEINKLYQIEDGSKVKYVIEYHTNSDSDRESKIISGKTDVLVYRGFERSALDIISQLELKPPFDSLYHKTSDYPKHQTVAQCIGLRKLKDDASKAEQKPIERFVNAGLTDIFTIFVCYSFN
jgi:hypothetical protein